VEILYGLKLARGEREREKYKYKITYAPSKTKSYVLLPHI